MFAVQDIRNESFVGITRVRRFGVCVYKENYVVIRTENIVRGPRAERRTMNRICGADGDSYGEQTHKQITDPKCVRRIKANIPCTHI